MVPNDLTLLDTLLDDQAGQPAKYLAGRYWQGNAGRMVRAIRREGLDRFRSSAAVGKGYADVVVSDASDLWEGAGWKLRALRALSRVGPVRKHLVEPQVALVEAHVAAGRKLKSDLADLEVGDRIDDLVPSCLDTLRGEPGDVVDVAGRTIATSYLRHARQLAAVEPEVPLDRARVLCEIGGGFGAAVHSLVTTHPNITKVLYVDIVPTLYVGTMYLRSFFGAAAVDYRAVRTGPITFADDDELEIVCIPPWALERVDADVDVVWNSASLREMDRGQVTFYGSEIRRLRARWLCLFQVPTDRDEWRETGWSDVVAALPGYRFEPVAMPDGSPSVVGTARASG